MMPSQQKAKKQRCFAEDKLAYKFQKNARRWAGLGISKQQQVYRNRNIALTAKEQTVAAKQQQLAASKEKLNEKEAKLMHTSREKYREADAAKAARQSARRRGQTTSCTPSLAVTS